MSYLLSSPARTNTKMARLGYGEQYLPSFLERKLPVPTPPVLVRLAGMGLYPTRLPNLGYGEQYLPSFLDRKVPPAPPPIAVRLAGIGYGYQSRLGDFDTSLMAPRCVYYGADGQSIESIDDQSSIVECRANGGKWFGPPALNTPDRGAGVQNPSPVTGGASNGGITTVMATTPSKDPLDYVSPQAAIAAGLDPQTVYNKWTASLARFPSPQAAIAAGVPAGVVNQLWQQANVDAANEKASTASSGFFGLSTTALVGIGGGVVLLALLGGKRRR